MEIAIGTVPMEVSVLTSLNRGTEDDRDSVLPDSGSHIHLYGELSTIAAPPRIDAKLDTEK